MQFRTVPKGLGSGVAFTWSPLDLSNGSTYKVNSVWNRSQEILCKRVRLFQMGTAGNDAADHCYSLLSIAIHCYPLLFIAIHCYSLLFIAIHCYSLLFIAEKRRRKRVNAKYAHVCFEKHDLTNPLELFGTNFANLV